MKQIALFIAFQMIYVCTLCAQDLTGTWQGTVDSRPAVPITLEIARLGSGALTASITLDNNGQRLPVESFSLKDSKVSFSSQVLASSYQGKVDGNSIVGSWVQGSNRRPLTFSRAASEDTSNRSVAILRAPPPMAANVDPSFEVATIKPSNPADPGKKFWSDGRHYRASGASLMDLLQVAYGMKSRQILGLPAWAEQARYDLEAEFAPDQGMPSKEQFQQMLQKLLTERFGLQLHLSEKQFDVYALVVDSRGTRLKPSEDSSDARHRAFLSPGTGGGRLLIEKNATMSDLAAWLMSQLPDWQIIDKTCLKGKFDFQLNFLPENSQASSRAEAAPQAADAGEAPYPPQAIEEQLGLKLVSTRAKIPVIVVDKVEMPSAN